MSWIWIRLVETIFTLVSRLVQQLESGHTLHWKIFSTFMIALASRMFLLLRHQPFTTSSSSSTVLTVSTIKTASLMLNAWLTLSWFRNWRASLITAQVWRSSSFRASKLERARTSLALEEKIQTLTTCITLLSKIVFHSMTLFDRWCIINYKFSSLPLRGKWPINCPLEFR